MTSPKTLELRFDRLIPAPPAKVYDAWLNPKVPGTPWNEASKLILQPQVDGMFFWADQSSGTAHYGRFTEVSRPGRLAHTWVSPYTGGQESQVTVTFVAQGEGTKMTLVHAGLPDDEGGRAHEEGWNYFLDKLTKEWGS
jgi:uncharacterized protein YndB with AHSA1/START domain